MVRDSRIVRGMAVAIASLCIFLTCPANAQVPSNVLRRVLMIRAGENTGTGFTLDVDGRQYLITAKHVVAGLKPEDTIDIRKGTDWAQVKVKVLLCEGPIDIAVIIPPSQLTVTFPLEPNTSKFFYGQEAYFTGFPYGLSTSGKNVNGLYPLAFIKKGIFSATSSEDGAVVIFLDGHNNPGFSGGPIVYRDLNQTGPPVFHVAAVISGYRPEFEPVRRPRELKPGEVVAPQDQQYVVTTPDGKKFLMAEAGTYVRLNTGIVKGFDIKYAIELIRKNPGGPKVTDQFESK